MSPDNWRPYFLLGELYAKRGMGDAAVDAYAAAVERDSENPDLRNDLGLTLVRTERPGEGESHLLKAIRLAPDMIEAVLNLAFCYATQEKWKPAKEQANLVIQKTEAGSDLHEKAKRLLVSIANAESVNSK